MIYGFEEKENASEDSDPIEIAKNVYRKTCGLSPKILNSHRIGAKTAGKTRPIKVEVEHPALVQGLLQAAHKLKTSDYSSVYLAPDRSKEERAANNKLVTTMKSMIKQDPSKYYYIRNNKVNCIDKTLSSSESG